MGTHLDPGSGGASASRGLIIGFGYLGREIARRWQATGLRVTATTRDSTNFAAMTAAGVEPILFDVMTSDASTLPAVDRVVYCVGFDRRSPYAMRTVYETGVERVLRGIPKPRRIVYISSTGVYGDANGEWIDETAPTHPEDEGGEACLAAEGACMRVALERGLDVVRLRLAGLYGPGRMLHPHELHEGAVLPGDPEAWLNLIHVSDAAAAVEAAFQQAKTGEVFLVSDGHPVRRRDFYAHLAERMGAPVPRFDPALARRHRGSRRISNRRMLTELGVTLKFADYRAGLEDALAQVAP